MFLQLDWSLLIGHDLEMIWKGTHLSSGGKSAQLSYLSKSKDTLTENDSSKSESHPVKYYLSKSQKVFDCLIYFRLGTTGKTFDFASVNFQIWGYFPTITSILS